MRKVLLLLIFFVSLLCFGQRYEVIDSLPLEYITVHFDKDIDNSDFINLDNGDYMAPLPHKDNLVIRLNFDRTKAIVVYNSYCFGRHLEFNVKETDRRIILWYQSSNLYCGYIYDKRYKVCKYFEDRKELKRFIRKPIFRYYDNKVPKMPRRNRTSHQQRYR